MFFVGQRLPRSIRHLRIWNLAIIGVYFLIVFGIGFYLFTAQKRTSERIIFMAGRDVGWFFIGASLFVSNIIQTEHFIWAFRDGRVDRGLGGGHFEWWSA